MPGVKGQVQARGVERRRAIVEAAIEHFAREGYRGTGIAAIAEAAGVTTGGLLHHFGSKEGLLVEVLRERDRLAIKAFVDLGHDSVENDFDQWAAVATWNEERADLALLYTVLLAESLDKTAMARLGRAMGDHAMVQKIGRQLVEHRRRGGRRVAVEQHRENQVAIKFVADLAAAKLALKKTDRPLAALVERGERSGERGRRHRRPGLVAPRF